MNTPPKRRHIPSPIVWSIVVSTIVFAIWLGFLDILILEMIDEPEVDYKFMVISTLGGVLLAGSAGYLMGRALRRFTGNTIVTILGVLFSSIIGIVMSGPSINPWFSGWISTLQSTWEVRYVLLVMVSEALTVGLGLALCIIVALLRRVLS
jgi:hypothetical protein